MLPKILILLWKNLLMRKNHPFVTALEITLPISFVILVNAFVPKPEEEKIDNDHMSFESYEDALCMSRHGRYGNILYEPSTPFTNMLMSKAACYAGYKKTNVKPGKLNDNSSHFNIGVRFELDNSTNNIPDVLNYTLYPTNTLWVNLNTLWKHKGPTVPKYSIFLMHNVIELQRAIDATYLFMKNVTASKINLQNTEVHILEVILLGTFLYVAVFLVLLFMLPPIISRIVQEKYTGAKELMLMMGVRKIDIWVARFLDVYFIQLIVVTAVIIFFYVPLSSNSMVFQNNSLALWGIIMFGLIGCIIFLFFLSCFFQQSTFAVFIIGCVWVISYFVNNYLYTEKSIPGFVIYLTCLFPHSALINGVFIWLQFEKYGKTVNLVENVSGKDGPLLYEIYLLMILNIIIYGILTWYFENIMPGKYGIPKPFNFFFKKSYWVHRKVNISSGNSNSNEIPGTYEPVHGNLNVSISIQNVSKTYKLFVGRSVLAVDQISLNFFEGEISGLLGHNGAGKTTVFSMITGLTYPSSGKIFVDGYDIETNTDKARHSLGLCPQHDMLFNDLTTMQILKFYGAIKGLTFKNAKNEAVELIEKLKLKGSEKTKCFKLSGGQKRKVSLAIALIGGSKVLILDEPTSGMDPEIRREIWELLLKYRKKRTMLLTTHFMEEADALCDRIAIMDGGKVKCYGSSMFLKSKYGKGYVLNVVLNNVENKSKLTDYVQRSVSNAKLKSQNIRTLSFELPESKVDSFPSLLSGLEKKQTDNEIISYSINVASFEEVFLSLKSGQDDFDRVDSSRYTSLEVSQEPNLIKISGFFLFFQQFWTLLLKKWIIYRKSYIALLTFAILPAVIVVVVAFLSSDSRSSGSEVDFKSSRPLSYSLGLYKPSVVLYANHDDSHLTEPFEKYIQSFGAAAKETLNVTEAINQTFQEDFYKYSRLLNLGVEFLHNQIDIFHNQEAVHMVPVSLNLIHNFLLNYAKKNSSIVTSVDPKFANKDTYTLASKVSQKCTVTNILDFGGAHSFFYLIGPVKENSQGAKELQLMVTSVTLYWLTHLLWDILSFFLYIVILYLVMGLTQADDSMLHDPVEVLSGYFLWGIGLLLICYIIASFLKNLAGAFCVKVLLYAVFTFVVYSFITLGAISKNFQYLHPSVIFKVGLLDLCSGKKREFILTLFIYDLVLFILLILKDSKILGFLIHRFLSLIISVNYNLPQDRKEELVKQHEDFVKTVVRSKAKSDYVLIGHQLKRWYFKVFKAKPAVRGISFLVSKGECFGLLGVNGAGKTSTFKMLTGEISSSYGKVYVCSQKFSLFLRQKYLFSIGYCPQFGGLIPTFTGIEILTFFARMRGIRNSNVKDQVNKWLTKFGLWELAKKRCATYSGGNQRKITTAASVIGDPPLIFLDEPTTGVDPVARRSIWNLISEIQKNGQAIVLTSHSMDECEALCSRVAIMVKGRFRCIGETTTLKDKYGQGYSVRLKVIPNASAENLQSLKRAVLSTFHDCELVDEHLTTLQYKVSSKNSSAEIFKKLLDLKRNHSILESYSASAATLEQIFIGFAREE